MHPAPTAGPHAGPNTNTPGAFRADEAAPRRGRPSLAPWAGAGPVPVQVHLHPATARAARRIMARQSRQRFADADASERRRYAGLAHGTAPTREVVDRVRRAVSP